jgi:hypothetical protein
VVRRQRQPLLDRCLGVGRGAGHGAERQEAGAHALLDREGGGWRTGVLLGRGRGAGAQGRCSAVRKNDTMRVDESWRRMR